MPVAVGGPRYHSLAEDRSSIGCIDDDFKFSSANGSMRVGGSNDHFVDP